MNIASLISRGKHWFLSLPLRLKISLPYILVAALLAGFATYQVGRSFVSTLEQRFLSQLADAAARTNEGLIDFEEAHLEMYRSVVFTSGVPQALQIGDIRALRERVLPLAINNQFPLIDILTPEGEPLLSIHQVGRALGVVDTSETDFREWDMVARVVEGETDALGDKFVGFVDTSWGTSLYTAGPVRLGDDLVGIVLVGTPVDRMVQELRNVSVADVGIYSPTGDLTANTIDRFDALSDETVATIRAQSDVLSTRLVSVNNRNYVEALDEIQLRGQDVGWYLGNALPEALITETRGPSLIQLILIFMVGFLAIIGLGVVMAQLISDPIFKLLTAAQEVGQGKLDMQVEVSTADEVGQLTQGFNQMIRDLQEREFISDLFGRMVSEDVREAVLGGEVELGGDVHEVAVLFTDIQGFTSLTEKSNPDEVIGMLNEFFGVINTVTHLHNGLINSFGGDSALAVFGAPIQRPLTSCLRSAISTAIDIRRGVAVLNAIRVEQGQKPIRFGIGINAGDVVAGNLGSKERFEYTVIGDPVNVASRLESLSREFPRTPVLLPGNVVEMLDGTSSIAFEYLGDHEVKGKGEPISTYAVVGSTANIPDDFTLFDHMQYPHETVFTSYFLYCLGYDHLVVGKALGVHPRTIIRWLTLAPDAWDVVETVLREEFNLDSSGTQRLKNYGMEPELSPTETEEVSE